MALTTSPSESQESRHEPREIQRLVNPAYCSGVVGRFISSYCDGDQAFRQSGLTLDLAFLCLPMVLHGPSQDSILSHNKNYSLHRLAHEHQDVLIGLDRRVEGLSAITRRSLLFGHAHGLLQFNGTGLLTANAAILAGLNQSLLGKPGMRPLQAARLLGLWMARAGRINTLVHLRLRF